MLERLAGNDALKAELGTALRGGQQEQHSLGRLLDDLQHRVGG